MEDQRVGTGLSDKLLKVLGTSSKWVGLAVLLAMVDARFGGKPRLLELLRSGMGGLGSRLPV